MHIFTASGLLNSTVVSPFTLGTPVSSFYSLCLWVNMLEDVEKKDMMKKLNKYVCRWHFLGDRAAIDSWCQRWYKHCQPVSSGATPSDKAMFPCK